MSDPVARSVTRMRSPDFKPPHQGIGAFRALLDAIPDLAVILDTGRRAVFVNQTMRDWLGQERFERLSGQKPGEIIGCIHSHDAPDGCGDGDACQFCGANIAIRTALKTEKAATGECRITVDRQGVQTSLDLRIGAYPYHHRQKLYLVVTINDISDQKRRQALERIFFHDIINTAGGLKGILDVIGTMDDPDEIRDLLKDVSQISDQLLEEIRAQKELSQAENNELVVHNDSHLAGTLIREAVHLLSHHRVAERYKISIKHDPVDPAITIHTDRNLAVRILVNMLKNAIEASPKGAEVRVYARLSEAASPKVLRICVHNEGVMSREVQLQLFQRSFSTKGSNRGLGTYSMKLLAERYLKGRIYFESSAETGTIFVLELPLGAAPA